MKKQSYFSHDSNARNDEKLLAVRMMLGVEGYGIYFMILERLREEADYTSIKDYNALAFDFRVSADKVKKVVEDFGLFSFVTSGERFYSDSFMRRMTQKDDLAAKRSAGGKKAMQNRWGGNDDVTQEPLKDNPPITNPPESITSKVKGSKVKSNSDELPTTSGASGQSIDYAKLVGLFNSKTKGKFGTLTMPLSATRKKMIKARVSEHGKDAFVEVIRKSSQSLFLSGQNGRGFTLTFDWMIKPSNFEKILTGNYDNRKNDTNGSNGKSTSNSPVGTAQGENYETVL